MGKATVGEQGVLLYNHDTQQKEYVKVDDVKGAIASGKYSALGGVETDAPGGKMVRDVSELGAARTQGESVTDVSASQRGAERVRQMQRDAVDTAGNRAITFAEGAVDSFSLGTLSAKDVYGAMTSGGGLSSVEEMSDILEGPAADVRRDVFSGTHTAGEIVGTIGSLLIPGGAAGKLAQGGTKAGQMVARTLIGEQRVAAVLRAREAAQAIKAAKAAKTTADLGTVAARYGAGAASTIGVRAAEEAGAGAVLAGAMAFNHQLHDAILEDKPFVGEAILHDIKMGSLLGGGLGTLSGGASSLLTRASRKQVMAQSGLLDLTSDFSKNVHSDIRGGIEGFHGVVDEHEVRLGVLKELANEGHLPTSFMREREVLVKQAKAAKEKLAGLDMDAALSGTDNKAYTRWRDAMENYQAKVVELDEAMRPKFVERATIDQGRAQVGRRVETAEGPAASPWNMTQADAREGGVTGLAQARDVAMAGDEAAQLRYKQIYGEEFVPVENLESGRPLRTERQAPVAGEFEARPGTMSGQAEGQRLPQSGASRPVEAGAEAEIERGPFARRSVRDPLLGGPQEGLTQAGYPGGPRPPRPWVPQAEPGPFNPAEFPTEASAELGGRNLTRRANEPDWLNQNYGNRELRVLPDGSMMPAKDAAQNAQSFSLFRQKALDTGTFEAAPARGYSEPPVAAPKPLEGEGTNPGSRKRARDVGREVASEERAAGEPVNHPEFRPGEAPDVEGFQKAQVRGKKEAVNRFLDEWMTRSMAEGPKVTPADRAAAKLGGLMDQIKLATGGALDSAGGAQAMTLSGLKPAATSFGSQIDQIIAARQLGAAAADASRGVKGSVGNGLLKWAGKRISAKLLSSAMGGAVGGPVGYVLGYAWGDKLFGFAGRSAGAAGRLTMAVTKTVDGLLSGRGATRVGAALRAAAGANNPVAYSDAGPIEDPVQRVLEVKRVASNPDALKNYVLKQMGDIATLHPEVADHAAELAKQRIVALSLRAPAVYFDQLGNTVGPATQAMRRWLELENATHNVDAVLESVGAGVATEAQIDGLRTQHPGVYQRVVTGIMSDPDRLRQLPRTELKKVEAVLGIPLHTSSDPGFVARQLEAWSLHAQQTNTGGITPPAPTPAQAGNTAPGNQ